MATQLFLLLLLQVVVLMMVVDFIGCVVGTKMNAILTPETSNLVLIPS